MTLRRACAQDLSFIVALEQRFHGLNLVGADDLATHQQRMSDPDCQYWIADNQGSRAGHVILRGIQSEDCSVELKRIVISEPGQGLGRMVLRAMMSKVFDELGAQRLWLDVFEHNARARHVYRSVGFAEEGVDGSLVVMAIGEGQYRRRMNQ
jgi:RimJ/RimL family protein N-acetyltransferase